MVLEDTRGCWHSNGRPSLRQPTGPVYELFRQVGVHPVRGRGRGAGTGAGEVEREGGGGERARRDFLVFTEYAFCRQRMLKNCARLRVGAIANRSSASPIQLHVCGKQDMVQR